MQKPFKLFASQYGIPQGSLHPGRCRPSEKPHFAYLPTERTNLILNGRILAGDTHQIASAEGERNSDDAAQLASDVHANSPHDQATGHLMVPAMFPSLATSFIMNGKITTAPFFDKALKYPIPNAVSIHPHHRIRIIEGLDVFLAIRPWSDGGLLLDERWLIQLDQEKARRPTRVN